VRRLGSSGSRTAITGPRKLKIYFDGTQFE
jgi:hypothetical protein